MVELFMMMIMYEEQLMFDCGITGTTVNCKCYIVLNVGSIAKDC